MPVDSTKPTKSKGSALTYLAVAAVILAAIPALKTLQAGDPISFIFPNVLLFTSYREEVRNIWQKTVNLDKAIIRDPQHVPVIDAKDYSFESLKTATENWRYPAIVRGLFLDTPASKKWPQPGYLSGKIGDYSIPVVRNAIYGTLQNDRKVMTFRESYEEILEDENSKLYLFFPVKSRFSFNHSEMGALEQLQEAVNKVVEEDLEIDKRIWPGFGTKIHKTFYGSQLIMGRGSNDSDATTGTGWHCAAGNNWFVQVAGTKRWYFMDPKYSAYMYPLRGGKVNMQTGNINMGDIQKHLPLRYADVKAGDLLYNPDWEWHTIKNYEGLSIGVPIRELNVSLSLRNNLQYTGIVLLNKALEKFGLDIGGYPPGNSQAQ